MSAEFITARAVSPTRHHHGGDASIDLDDNNHHKPHHHHHHTLSSISTSSSTSSSSSSTTTSTSPLIPSSSSLPIRNNNNTLGSYTSNEPRTIHGDHDHNDDHLDDVEEYSSSIPSPPLKNINRCTRLNYDTTMIPTYIHQIEKYIQTILDRYMFFGVTPTLTYSIVQHTQKNHHAQRQSNEYLFILEQENSTLGHVASGHTVGTTTTLSPFKYLKNKKKRKSNQYENVCIEFTLSLNGFVFSESHPFHLQLLDHFAVLFNPNASSTSSSSHENNDLTHSGMNDDASSSSSSGGGNSHENLLNNVHSNHHHHHSQQQQVNTSSHSSIQLFKSSGGDDDDLDASVFGEYGMYRLDVGTASHHHYLSSYYSSNPLNSLDYQCISKYVQKCMILLNLLNNALIDLEMSSSTLHGGGTRHHSTTALNSSTSSVNNHGTTNSSIGHSPPPHPTSQSLPDHHGTGSSSSSSNTFSRATTTSSRKFSQDYKFTVRRAGVHVYKWNLRENNNTHTPMEPQHEASSSSATNRLSSKLIAMHQSSQQRSSLNPQQSQQQQTSPRSLILSYRSCLSPSRIIPFLLRLTKTHVKRYLKYKHVMNTSFGLSTIKQPYYDDLKNWIFEHFIFFKYTQYYPFVLFCDILRSYMLGNITAKKICKIKTNVKELKKQEMKQEKPKRSRMITFRRKTPPSSQPSSQPSSFSQTIRSSNASDQKNDETSTSTSRESTDVRTPQEEYSILLKIIEMAQKNYLIYSGSLSQDQLDWKESTLVRNCNQLVHLLCKLDGSIYSGNLAETSEYGHTNTLTTTGTTTTGTTGSTGTTHMNIHHESPSNANSTTTAMTSSTTTTTTLIEPIVQSSFNIFFVLFLKQMDLSMHSHENDPFTHQQEVMTPKIQKRIIHSNATMNSSRNNTTHTSIDTTINTTTSTNTTTLTNSTTLTTKNSTTTITNTTTSNKNSNTMNEYARMDEYHIQSQTLERKHIETLFQYEHEMICRFIDHKCYSQQHWSQQIFRGFTSNSMKLFERNEHVLFDAIRICNVPLIKMLISKFEQVFGSERIMYFINHENDNCITPLHLLHILYGRVIKTNVHCQEIISYLEKKGARRNESFVMVMRPVSGGGGSVHGVHGNGNSSGSGGVSDDHHSNHGQESTLKNHHDQQHDHHATSSYYRARHTTTTTVLPSHHRWNRVQQQHQQHQHQQHQDGSLNHVSSTIMNNTSNHHPHTTNRHTEGGKMSHSYNTIISKSNLIMTTTIPTTIPTTTTNNNHRTATATLTSLEVPTRMKFLLSTLESLDMDIWIHILSYRAFSMRTINSLCAVSTEILKNFIQCESIWQRVCYHYFTKHNVNSSLLPQLGKIERMLQDDHLSWRYITKCWTQPSYFKIFALDPKNRMEHAQLLENNSFLKKPQRGDHSTIKSSHALEPQQQQEPLGVSEPTSSDFLRVSTSSTTSTTSILSDYNNQQLLYYYERDSFQVEMHDFYMLMDVMNREASISIPKQEVMEHFRQKYGTSKLAKTGILSNYSIYCKRLNVENLFTASAALSKLTLSQQKWIFNFIECIRYYFEKKKEFLIKTDREDMLCYEITLTNNFVEEEQQRTNGVVLLVFNTVTNWIGCFEC
ncbi:hypothetical protein C9374_007361 [Naegleria lovaniensis]|uniref:Uncharacterized protein n=1 Tax=Naegleria lovaniensis TaxID=51637 RepID=A0AA88GGW7_NAELO|nr:uncharacterized protein C9374_007361 [Naegleria lovaniensis]KAG2379222.1 hypothetical protein C9374_007361 [Naegleria lovaniensis]